MIGMKDKYANCMTETSIANEEKPSTIDGF
jgi:hypothetical protein